jgi:hypothetical protein
VKLTSFQDRLLFLDRSIARRGENQTEAFPFQEGEKEIGEDYIFAMIALKNV